MMVTTPSSPQGEPAMPLWQLPADLSAWVLLLALPLQARSRPHLLPLLAGVLFAKGRRTVTAWLRAAGLSEQFRTLYYFLSTLGRHTHAVARLLLLHVLLPHLGHGQRLLFGLDDTPTRRYGPRVEGAGIHHDPAPGPAGATFLYGHVWVTLAWLAPHPDWGAIALPLLALLYVRRGGVAQLPRHYRWAFRTKLEMAAELVRWLATWTRWLGVPLGLVADGAYARRPVLRAAAAEGVTFFSRLRRDAALYHLPPPRRPGRRGRPRLYGAQRISLALRAAAARGWQEGRFVLYREEVTKRYKTFLATWRPAGGVIRVVLVQEELGWESFFSTDPGATAAQVLGAIADRGALEQCFHDVKEVWGAGQQQLRNLWANVGAWHVSLWMHSLVEAWAWWRAEGRLVDRRLCPWDDEPRRPSHADKRKSLQRECLGVEYREAGRGRGRMTKYRRLAQRLLRFVIGC
jgi:DDE superfamily endonuclease